MIRKMTNDDLNQVMVIENDSFASPWDINSMKYELNENPYANYLVYEINEKVVGYIGFWITFDSSTIVNIAVSKDYRKQGIAQSLLNEAFRIAENNMCEFMTLEVRVSNTNAINLYKKNEFIIVNTKVGYYVDNHEDAFYMVKALKVEL